MIRVFIIAILALAALVVVTRSLPDRPMAESGMGPGAAGSIPEDEASPFAEFVGAWEGTFNAYDPDGTLLRSLRVRQENTPAAGSGQAVIMIDQYPDGTAARSSGSSIVLNGRLENRLTGPDGILKILEGRKVGDAIWWHRRDEAAGVVESYRERIIRTGEGDLYAIDGIGVYGEGAGILLFEGRYRRAEMAPE